jgi:hypothetical protein
VPSIFSLIVTSRKKRGIFANASNWCMVASSCD